MSARASIAARFSSRRDDDATAVVDADGALDLASAPRLRRTLAELADERHTRIVIDLSRVTFIDSTALAVLVGVERRLRPHGVLAVAAASPQAQRLFELTGLDRTIRMFPTVDAAITAVREPDEHGSDSADPSVPLSLTRDASVVLGIASTAMPFADSRREQVERWLWTLLRHGETGIALAALGFTDEPAGSDATRHEPDPKQRSHRLDRNVAAVITRRAHGIAAARGALQARTADVLTAVMEYYGPDFDRVLNRHRVHRAELIALLEADPADPGE